MRGFSPVTTIALRSESYARGARMLGSGWAIFVEAQRHAAGGYPAGRFPDVASALVDAERQAQFDGESDTANGGHFESSYYLTLVWLPPAS
jgi:type IV secretion system protein VirB4